MRFGTWEIILIIVLVLIVFGGSKLAGVGKSLGKSIKDFKEEVGSSDKAENTQKDEDAPKENGTSEQTASQKKAAADSSSAGDNDSVQKPPTE